MVGNRTCLSASFSGSWPVLFGDAWSGEVGADRGEMVAASVAVAGRRSARLNALAVPEIHQTEGSTRPDRGRLACWSTRPIVMTENEGGASVLARALDPACGPLREARPHGCLTMRLAAPRPSLTILSLHAALAAARARRGFRRLINRPISGDRHGWPGPLSWPSAAITA